MTLSENLGSYFGDGHWTFATAVHENAFLEKTMRGRPRCAKPRA
jgi:hypothetical protein